MNNNVDKPMRFANLLIAWAAFILSTGSLFFSLWVTLHLHQTLPGGLFARYGLVSLGIAMTAGTMANLLSFGSRYRRWLMVVLWTALAISFLGLYQVSRRS